jgi:hypothetical protein
MSQTLVTATMTIGGKSACSGRTKPNRPAATGSGSTGSEKIADGSMGRSLPGGPEGGGRPGEDGSLLREPGRDASEIDAGAPKFGPLGLTLAPPEC